MTPPPHASVRLGAIARIVAFFRRREITLYCPACGRVLEGQRTRDFKRARSVCGGNFDFAMPGDPPVRLCLGFMKVSR